MLIWVPVVGLGVLVFAAIFIYLGYRWSWTGFGQAQHPKDESWEIRPSRSLWDWLGLLVIPVVLTVGGTVGGLLFAYQQNERQQEIDAQQQEIENQRAQLLALEGYLDEIGNLLLDTNTPLRQSHEGDPVQDLARARTLTMLDMLSPERKPRVLEFLFEMELIQTAPPDQKNPIISLKFADLREVYLAQRHILKSAELGNADMQEANLRRAMLSNTNLRKADLGKVKLVKADLTEADLTEADLTEADLTEADLTEADLTEADLTEADLTEANLRGAKGVSCQQTEQTKSLDDATMPGGQNYEDWLKDKGCGKD